MPTTTSSARALSWQKNVLWTSAGTLLYAAANWAMLSAIAKFGTARMVGELALGLAVSAPVLLLSQMNLRALIATDARGEYRFGDYRQMRLNATLLAVVVLAAIAVAGYSPRVAAVIVMVGLAQAVEGVSDIYYGLMQQHERMDRITISMALRGPLGLVALAVTVWLTGSVLWGAAALLVSRMLVLGLYDARRGSREFTALEPPSRLTLRDVMARQGSMFKLALPLSSVMLLTSLCLNIPRYFIEGHIGTAELGMFSAAASLVSVGNNVINAVGMAVTPRLAKLYAWEDTSKFTAFVLRLLAGGVALGICAIACAVLLGHWVLSVMFRPEYATHADLLTYLMVGGALSYLASLAGYAVTAARSFRAQVPVMGVTTLVTLIACATLIPAYGLAGAAAATALSSATQLAGLGWLFFRLSAKGRPIAIPVPEPELNV